MNDPPNYRPSPPKSTNEQTNEMLDLMKLCWAETPSNRPSFIDISKMLKRINKGQ
jgi:Protein tyrosine and serine/threonine kinase